MLKTESVWCWVLEWTPVLRPSYVKSKGWWLFNVIKHLGQEATPLFQWSQGFLWQQDWHKLLVLLCSTPWPMWGGTLSSDPEWRKGNKQMKALDGMFLQHQSSLTFSLRASRLPMNRGQKSLKRGLSILFRLSLVLASTLTYSCVTGTRFLVGNSQW